MFSNGNSTNFSTVRLRIIDIFTEADILNIKSWKKLNFRLSPREKMQEKNQDKSNMIFFEIMIYYYWNIVCVYPQKKNQAAVCLLYLQDSFVTELIIE